MVGWKSFSFLSYRTVVGILRSLLRVWLVTNQVDFVDMLSILFWHLWMTWKFELIAQAYSPRSNDCIRKIINWLFNFRCSWEYKGYLKSEVATCETLWFTRYLGAIETFRWELQICRKLEVLAASAVDILKFLSPKKGIFHKWLWNRFYLIFYQLLGRLKIP